jgi:hypothetical protein
MDARRMAGRVVGLWLGLLATVLVVFAVQENVEHVLHHGGHLPLADVLYVGEYTWTVPIFAIVALAAAAVGTVAIERIRLLAEAVRWWEGRHRSSAARIQRPGVVELPPSHHQRTYRGRAPPRLRSVSVST